MAASISPTALSKSRSTVFCGVQESRQWSSALVVTEEITAYFFDPAYLNSYSHAFELPTDEERS
jgi:hypothetical protein